MDEEYYRKQIKGLYLTISDMNGSIHNDYIQEKLKLILNGQGINFHKCIEEVLNDE